MKHLFLLFLFFSITLRAQDCPPQGDRMHASLGISWLGERFYGTAIQTTYQRGLTEITDAQFGLQYFSVNTESLFDRFPYMISMLNFRAGAAVKVMNTEKYQWWLGSGLTVQRRSSTIPNTFYSVAIQEPDGNMEWYYYGVEYAQPFTYWAPGVYFSTGWDVQLGRFFTLGPRADFSFFTSADALKSISLSTGIRF